MKEFSLLRHSEKPMRHPVLSLMIAFLAAIACFVLLPVGLVLLKPAVIEDDTLAWIWAFAGPALLGLLLSIAVTVGFVAFLVSKVKLPDRDWRSTQTFVILVTFAATMVAIALITWPFFITIEPPEAGPQQAGLPSLGHAQSGCYDSQRCLSKLGPLETS
jgi:MFS family permease